MSGRKTNRDGDEAASPSKKARTDESAAPASDVPSVAPSDASVAPSDEPRASSIEATMAQSEKNIAELLKFKRPEFPVSDQFLLFMARMRPQDLALGQKTMVTVRRTDTLQHVLKLLISHKILSAPVLTQVGNFFGFVDMLDVVRYISDLVGEGQMSKDDFDIDAHEEFQKATVNTLMKYPISKRNPFHPVRTDQSMLSVVEILARGVHRVPVLNEKDEIVHMVTQSAVIKFINEHMDMIGAKRAMKIHQMEAGLQYVVSVLHEERAIDAFKTLKVCNISGLAIVDDQGRLIGVLSGRDIKNVASTGRWINRLFRPVSEFIKNKPIYVRADDTLATAIHKCAEHEVHRVFVVNEQLEPIGVVSLTDILRELLQNK